MILTPHFKPAEFVRSQIALRRGIVNEPDRQQWIAIYELCSQILEPARAKCGPITITSGYRCKELNEAIPGSDRSDHMIAGDTCAADVVAVNLGDLFRFVYIQLPWVKLIWEFGWVHISHSIVLPQSRTPRKAEMIRDDNGKKKVVYIPLTFEEIYLLGR